MKTVNKFATNMTPTWTGLARIALEELKRSNLSTRKYAVALFEDACKTLDELNEMHPEGVDVPVTDYIFKSPMIPAEYSANGNEMQMAARIVAYKRESGGYPERPYITHMEVFPTDRPMYRTIGNYDLTFEEAIDDAMARYERENRHNYCVTSRLTPNNKS